MYSREKYMNKIKGSFIGGAAGDALGYSVEFLQDYQIFEKYGEKGITEYSLTNGIAQISDDTQMSLFTANCVLFAETRLKMRGIGGDPAMYACSFYQDWLITQERDYDRENPVKRYDNGCGLSWLLDIPDLFSRRAPGSTCISALNMRKNGFGKEDYMDYTKNPINHSKGCGGIMRIAPVGLYYNSKSRDWVRGLDIMSVKMSAITHGHSLGYMPSAVLVHILNRIVYPFDESMTLKDIIIDARDTVAELYSQDPYVERLKNIINKAIALSENKLDDLENIQKLGEGWVAEETLAIAIYCSLRHQNSFSGGIIAAVNHSGDSDSTGAVTGNILGALLGYDSIEEKWLKNLEMIDVLNEMAEDLCHGCQMSEYGDYFDEDWNRKYIEAYWSNTCFQNKKSTKV